MICFGGSPDAGARLDPLTILDKISTRWRGLDGKKDQSRSGRRCRRFGWEQKVLVGPQLRLQSKVNPSFNVT